MAVRYGVDPTDLAQSGWGIILDRDADPAVYDALAPLLDLRQEQAGEHYRVFDQEAGYQPDDSVHSFLSRHGVGPGPADPTSVPYYLLIVGAADVIPYDFQRKLGIRYAVGRLDLDTLEEYASYAASVVAAEREELKLPPHAVFFGASHADDEHTRLLMDGLVAPLSDVLISRFSGWQFDLHLGSRATKAELLDVLGGTQTPALLFTASHGVTFSADDPRQRFQQGALLCADWPGPEAWGEQPIPERFYFSAQDCGSDAQLLGLVSVHVASYSAITQDATAAGIQRRPAHPATSPFVARLPQALLGHPKGGALATVGFADQVMGFSLPGPQIQNRILRDGFESALTRLMAGDPVGLSLDQFKVRYADLATRLSSEIENPRYQEGDLDRFELAELWAASTDAGNLAILGDPAVRLPVSPQGPEGHRAIEAVDLTPVYLNRLAMPSEAALLWAEGLRRAQDLPEVEPMDLLAGLFQAKEGPVEQLLMLFDDRQAVVQRLQERVVLDFSDVDISDGRLTTSLPSGETGIDLADISPPSAVEPRDVPLSQEAQRALARAYYLAKSHGIQDIRPRFLLAALIDDRQNGVGDWIAELLGVDQRTLAQHTVDTLPDGPDVDALRAASSRLVPAPEGELVPYAIQVVADPAIVPLGGGTTIAVDLIPFGDDLAAESLRVSALETDIALFIDLPPGFRCVGPDAVSVPLEPTGEAAVQQQRRAQRAQFRLLATGPAPPGGVTIEFLTSSGDRLAVSVDLQVEESKLDLEDLAAQPSPATLRPVPHPDLILQVLPVPDPLAGNVTFHYLLTRPAAVAREPDVYSSRPVPMHWQAQVSRILAAAVTGGHRAAPEESHARLAALGQELAYRFGPDDLWLALTAHGARTMLVLAPDDAWLPWELIHDGYQFLGERLVIARWPATLNNLRPYEFPVGQIHIAYFAQVDKPERWSRLMRLRNAPEPQVLPRGTLTGEALFTALGGLHILRQGPAPGEAEEPLPVVVRADDPEAGTQSAGRRNGPEDLGRSKLGLRSHRPVVSFSFLDAGVPGLTQLERRWASVYVSAGASAFVGPLWLVAPAVEAAFVRGFYDGLWEGRALGEAFRQGQQLARAAVPTSLDWMAYVLYGDPMARPYRPVEGEGYAVVESIGWDTDETIDPGTSVRFRLSVRREPPVWHTDRLVEVAQELAYQDLTARMVAPGLEVTPAGPVPMAKVGDDYLGWVTLEIPDTVADRSVLVEVYFMEGPRMVHMHTFPVVIGGLRGDNT